MIEVIGKNLAAFDKGRKVRLIPKKNVRIRSLRFERGGMRYDGSFDSEKVAEIPDILLMTHGVLVVCYEGIGSDGHKVIEKENFKIDKAERPADYVEPEIPQSGGVSKEYVDSMFTEYIEQVSELVGGDA